MGIEPTSSAWKAEVLPLNYTRGGHSLSPQNRIGKSKNLIPEKEASLRPSAGAPSESQALVAGVEGVGFEPT